MIDWGLTFYGLEYFVSQHAIVLILLRSNKAQNASDVSFEK